MKFLALALALLLAVGSRAASLQADAPSQLEHVRSAVGMYLNQLKDTATKALDHLDDTEYSVYKTQLTDGLDKLQAQLQVAQQSAAPYTNAFASQFMDATAAMRKSIMDDVSSLQTELEPKGVELRAVIERHVEQYRTHLEPIIRDHNVKLQSDMDQLKSKLEPIIADLRAMVDTNVEETKNALIPIVDTVRTKLIERLEDLKKSAQPYVNEYKEQLTAALSQVREHASSLNADEIQSKMSPHIETLKVQAGTLAEEAKAKLKALYDTFAAAVAA